MFLYHGTQKEIQFPIHPLGSVVDIKRQRELKKSYGKGIEFQVREGQRFGELPRKRPTDFGVGFYISTDKQFASLRACGTESEDAFLYTFELPEQRILWAKHFHFSKVNLQWLLFVAYNRGELKEIHAPKLYNEIREFSNQFDIISGPTANDKFFQFVNAFISHKPAPIFINYSQLISILDETALPVQYVLKTERACDALELLSLIKFNSKVKSEAFVLSRARSKWGEEYAKKKLPQYFNLQGYSLNGLLKAIEIHDYTFLNLPDVIPFDNDIENFVMQRYIKQAGGDDEL